MKSIVRVMCWKCSHITELVMNRLQEKKLWQDIPRMKKVCPDCKPLNEAITIVSGQTLFNPSKAYRCEHGHLSLIAPLGEMLNVCFGPSNEDFVNINGSISDLPNLIDNSDIACNHVVDGKLCDSKLTPIDDFQLSYPSSPAVKTKQRIGDLWDKHGVEPVRPGSYNNRTGDYDESRTQKANEHRLRRMRRKRNVEAERQPGRRVNKATKSDYGYRDKNSLDMS